MFIVSFNVDIKRPEKGLFLIHDISTPTSSIFKHFSEDGAYDPGLQDLILKVSLVCSLYALMI